MNTLDLWFMRTWLDLQALSVPISCFSIIVLNPGSFPVFSGDFGLILKLSLITLWYQSVLCSHLLFQIVLFKG